MVKKGKRAKGGAQKAEGPLRNQPSFERIKRATVAMAVLHGKPPSRPFTILGTGFCIHPRGVVVTCRHVVEAFFEKTFDTYIQQLPAAERAKEIQELQDVRSLIPHALFYVMRPERHEVMMLPCPVEIGVAKTDADLGLVRLAVHAAYVKGYPTVEIEDFDRIHEGMEVATCGFPLGSVLQERMGTVTSSFTRGIVSSIIPAPGASRSDVKAFQLDLRATHGNSGGPVFSLDRGRVFGVLQGGVMDDYNSPLFSRAESVYQVLEQNEIERLLAAVNPLAGRG